ncbi:hypothetical protein CLBKND_01629 [Methylorubrum aminovorans]
MLGLTNDLWTAIGVVVASLAMLIAVAAWLFPRTPRRKKVPEYGGEVYAHNQEKFAQFLQRHDHKIVRLTAWVSGQGDLINEWTDDHGNTRYSLTLQTGAPEGDCISEIEVVLEGEKDSNHSPLYFAHGGHNLDGFFLVRVVPGSRMGCGAVRITAVSAEQMALRN